MKLRNTLLAMIAVALPMSAFAQDEEAPPTLSDVWIVAPKVGMGNEFNEAVKEYMAWRKGQDDSRAYEVYSPVIGHNLNQVQFRACCFDWADQDAYTDESNEKGYGAKWGEMVGPYVDHVHHYIEESDLENSHWPADGDYGPYFGVTTWYIGEDAGPKPYEARKKMSQMAIEKGWASDENIWVWMTRTGGKPVLMIVSPYSSYADMAPPEESFFEFMTKEMGSAEEVQGLFNDFSKGKKGSDYTVWVERSDLYPADD